MPVHCVRDYFLGKLESKVLTEEEVKRVQRASRRYDLKDEKLWYKGKLVPDQPKALLKRLHLEYGHPTASALSKLVSITFDWEGRVVDTEEITAECDACKRGKYVQPFSRAQFVGRRSDWKLLDEWSIDLLPDFPKTERGFN